MPTLDLPQGVLHYSDTGTGPAVVLVHGALVDGRLWDTVATRLASRHRVIVPDLPLGSHRVSMNPDADLSPPGLARLLDEVVTALRLTGVTLVGNDTGGAICQLAAARDPAWLVRLVLTNCDAYENFLPPAFRYLQILARIPGGMWLLAQGMRSRVVRGLPIGYGGLSVRRALREVETGWVTPMRADGGIRRDMGKVLRGISPRYTLDAAARLRTLDLPVLLAWGRNDRFFRPAFAERLAADLPNARLELIHGARTFVPLDAPERLADLIDQFALADV